MTDTHPPPDDRDTDQPRSDDSHSGGGGISGLLRQLLDTLQRLDESGRSVERGRGRRRAGETAFEYEYSVNIGLGGDDTADSAEPDHPVRVQETLDGASVTVDLPAVDPETLRAGVDGRRLVVAADDERLARVTLPKADYTVRTATYNNGVLEIRLAGGDSEVTVDD
ncbi:gas vesicle protein GvpH [Halohasta salina]|uniref:gas vesicle protein GvpH n=1 Tax=Halohasta salina TaxID=2961621 RepID=UPI0020A373DC|nr:gas vesicle protein GvpH [Halohasta salina]